MIDAQAYRVALSTAPPDRAEAIARALVDERLAACVNLVPGLASVYRWQGEVCRDAETLLVIKTRADLLPDLERRLLAVHPYDTPELLVLPVEAGTDRYLAWLGAETRA